MSYVGIILYRFLCGKWSESQVHRASIGIPDLKGLSMDGENVDELCYSANLGALQSSGILKTHESPVMLYMATGIEIAMLREGMARLTKALNIEGRYELFEQSYTFGHWTAIEAPYFLHLRNSLYSRCPRRGV